MLLPAALNTQRRGKSCVRPRRVIGREPRKSDAIPREDGSADRLPHGGGVERRGGPLSLPIPIPRLPRFSYTGASLVFRWKLAGAFARRVAAGRGGTSACQDVFTPIGAAQSPPNPPGQRISTAPLTGVRGFLPGAGPTHSPEEGALQLTVEQKGGRHLLATLCALPRGRDPANKALASSGCSRGRRPRAPGGSLWRPPRVASPRRWARARGNGGCTPRRVPQPGAHRPPGGTSRPPRRPLRSSCRRPCPRPRTRRATRRPASGPCTSWRARRRCPSCTGTCARSSFPSSSPSSSASLL